MKQLAIHPLLWFGAILISVLMLACRESNPPKPPVDMQDIWDCYQSSNLDSIALRNALIGDWDWEYVSCFSTPDQASNTSSEGVVLSINADGTLEVSLESKLLESATWQLLDGSAGLFELETEPRISYLYGYILLCEDRILFNHSYIDGCDNYFARQ